MIASSRPGVPLRKGPTAGTLFPSSSSGPDPSIESRTFAACQDNGLLVAAVAAGSEKAVAISPIQY